eukprot:5444203-Pyramimonas_sp.AAC.1
MRNHIRLNSDATTLGRLLCGSHKNNGDESIVPLGGTRKEEKRGNREFRRIRSCKIDRASLRRFWFILATSTAEGTAHY